MSVPNSHAQTPAPAQTPSNSDQTVYLNPLVVKGEQSEPYFSSSATSATKSDTPLLDLPQTVNVVPRDLFVMQGA